MKLKRMAIAWLREEDWPRWLELDPGFQPHYANWLARMESTYEKLKAAGVNVVKVDVPVAEFEQWAATAGCKADTQGRSLFAAMRAQQMDLH